MRECLLREQERLVKRYGLELLGELLASLRKTGEDKETRTAADATKTALNALQHLTRILARPKYAAALRNPGNLARTPAGWSENSYAGAIVWLCDQLEWRGRCFHVALRRLLSEKKGLCQTESLKAAKAQFPAAILSRRLQEERTLLERLVLEDDSVSVVDWLESAASSWRMVVSPPFRVPPTQLVGVLERESHRIRRGLAELTGSRDGVSALVAVFGLVRTLVDGGKLDSAGWLAVQNSFANPLLYTILFTAVLRPHSWTIPIPES